MKYDLREMIVNPIRRLKPTNVDMQDFLAAVFSTSSRVISSYHARKDVDLPGLYLENGCIPVQGVGHKWRKVLRHAHIMARVDDRQPDAIEVEHKGHVFRMTRAEWELVRMSLTKRKGCDEI